MVNIYFLFRFSKYLRTTFIEALYETEWYNGFPLSSMGMYEFKKILKL